MINRKNNRLYRVFYLVIIFSSPFFVFGSVLKSAQKRAVNTITVNVNFKEARPNDTLWLVIENIIFSNPLKKPLGIYASRENHGQFHFRIPIQAKCGYWRLYKNRTFSATGSETNKMQIMPRFFWENGDNININLSHTETAPGTSMISKYSFSGIGCAKYAARSLAESVFDKTIPKNADDFDQSFTYHPYDTIKAKNALDSVEIYRRRMSRLSYDVLKADILFHYNGVFSRIDAFYKKNIANAPDSIKLRFIKAYKQHFSNPNTKKVPVLALNESVNYINFLYSKFKYESTLLHEGYDPNWIVDEIIENTKGTIRDRVVMMALISLQKADHLDALYLKLGKILTDENCRKILAELVANAPGKPFTNFDLSDINGKRVKLTDFKGKVVLIDFWFNGCGYCQVFYKNTLSKIEKDFEGNDNVVFVSINGDMGKNRWMAGIKEGTYTSNRAVNVFTDGEGFRHPVILKNNINGFPFVVLINKTGIIESRNSLDLYDYFKLTKAIKSLE